MTAEKILAIARGEIGTVEEAGNKTKYGKAYGMDGVYWCMIFMWWCFHEAGAGELFYGGQHCASCSQLMAWAKQQGRWVTGGYQAGDVLIFDFPGNNVKTDHTGICERVDGKYVYSIEGNTSPAGSGGSQTNGDGVYRKKREAKYVLGAYRPPYQQEEEETEVRYAYLKDIPEMFRPIVDTLMTAGIIGGDGSDPTGNGDKIDLSHDQVRTLVFAYRGGAFDRQLKAKGLPTAVK